MRPFNMKLLACFGTLLVLAMVINGCGSGSDLLDEVGGTTTFKLEVADGGNDDTKQIDVYRILDCDEDGVADDPEDPLTPAFGVVTVSISIDDPGMSVLSYLVNYRPVPSVDQTNTYQMPPALLSKSGQFTSFDVASGTTGADSFILMTRDQKTIVYNYLVTTAGIDQALYDIEIVLTYQDYEGHTKTRSIYVDVILENVVNCSTGGA